MRPEDPREAAQASRCPAADAMPAGGDSGDRPNPHLGAFVEAHQRERPHDPAADAYDVPAFTFPIVGIKPTPLYRLHTYWSKKPYEAIQEYVRHYTGPGDLVLDPFCGSGSTALAALLEGRKAIAIDRSPAATFITRSYCAPVDVAALREAFAALQARVAPEIEWLYETRCERCGGPAATTHVIYSHRFRCPRCDEAVPLSDCVQTERASSAGVTRRVAACPFCHRQGIPTVIDTRAERLEAIPVLASYHCRGGCRPARGERRYNDPDACRREYFVRYDLGKLAEIERQRIPHAYPTHRMMHAPDERECWGAKWRAGTSNFRTVDSLFTRRSLWALAALGAALDGTAGLLPLLWTAGILPASRMNGIVGGILPGTYYLPPVFREGHVLQAMERRLRSVLPELPLPLAGADLLVSTQSATDLSAIASDSVDYVFTDPPYAGKVQYGEMNFVWESWLRLDTRWHDEEIIVNRTRGKSEGEWAAMLRQAMAECFRVLKPGRWISLCYHDSSEGTWTQVQDLMAEVGFAVDGAERALFIDRSHKSYNQYTVEKVNQRDLVVNFRKPARGAALSAARIDPPGDEIGIRQRVRLLIGEVLGKTPGLSKDRVYDFVVSRLVRSGRMAPHDFDELLAQVAEEVREPAAEGRANTEGSPREGVGRTTGRWYLRVAPPTPQSWGEPGRGGEDSPRSPLGALYSSPRSSEARSIAVGWRGRRVLGRVGVCALRELAAGGGTLPALETHQTDQDFALWISPSPVPETILRELLGRGGDPRVLAWVPAEAVSGERECPLDPAAFPALLLGTGTGKDAEAARRGATEALPEESAPSVGAIRRRYARGTLAGLRHPRLDPSAASELSSLLALVVGRVLDDVYEWRPATGEGRGKKGGSGGLTPLLFGQAEAIRVINGLVKTGSLPRGAKPNRERAAAEDFGPSLGLLPNGAAQELDVSTNPYVMALRAFLAREWSAGRPSVPLADLYREFTGLGGARPYGLSRRMVQLYLLCLVREGSAQVTLRRPPAVLDAASLGDIRFTASLLDGMREVEGME